MICDTSGLLAALDPDDDRHVNSAAVLSAAPAPVLSPFAVVELDYLLRGRQGAAAARIALAELAGGAYVWPAVTVDDVNDCLTVETRYGDLGLGLVDASIVVLARRYQTRDLLTLDERHFRAVTPLQGGAFRLLPADA